MSVAFHRSALLVVAALLGSPAPALAADPLAALLACRAERDAAKRLACFDGAANEAARRSAAGELAVIDPKAEAQKAQRAFGQSETARRKGAEAAAASGAAVTGTAAAIPAAKVEVDRIESTLAAAQYSSAARLWAFRLADGSVWRQTDGARSTDRFSAGTKVTVRKGPLGSYIMELDGGIRELRVKRVN